MDWTAWARRAETLLRGDLGAEAWQSLFARGGRYRDPVNAWTTDLQAIHEQTQRLFPDWRQRFDAVFGDDHHALLEWIGEGTYRGPGAEGTGGVAVRIEGATVLEVDDEGLVISWRDYLDTNEVGQQIKAGLAGA